MEARVNWLNTVAGAGGANVYVRLYKTALVIGAGTQLAFFTWADFAGYTEFNSAAWTAPATLTNGDVYIESPVHVWEVTAITAPQTIYGAVATLGTGGGALMLAVYEFITPVVMAAVHDQVAKSFRLPLRSLAA